MADLSAADVEVEEPITGIVGCSPQSANIEKLKEKFMEQVDLAEAARCDAGEVESMMTPNILADSSLPLAGVTEVPTAKQGSDKNPDEYKWNIVWENVFATILLHASAIYGLYLAFVAAKYATILWGICVTIMTILGITAGSHRLWSHRTYKATWQLRLILIILQTMGYQNDVYTWVRNHRVHHKFTDTNADPHNTRRGFFFAHVGWLLIRKHPDVKNKGRHIDLSDLLNDPMIMFQRKYYMILMPLLCYAMPAVVPWYFWNENFWNSWYINIFRHIYVFNLVSLVNSAAHTYGYRSYDKSISPRENKILGFLVLGEGWHNYHHVFPWDYKAAELPTYGANMTLAFINLMAKIGWAYDLKTVPTNMVAQRALRTGDGSHGHEQESVLSSWGEGEMLEKDMKYCQILYKKEE